MVGLVETTIEQIDTPLRCPLLVVSSGGNCGGVQLQLPQADHQQPFEGMQLALLKQKLRSRSDPLQCWQSHTRALEDETALELPPGAMLIKPFTLHDKIRHQT